LENGLARIHWGKFIKVLEDDTSHVKVYAFETKGASSSTAGQKQFKFVPFDSPNTHLFIFREHLHCSPFNGLGRVFQTKKKNILLVAPRSLIEIDESTWSDAVYSHLAAFVWNGPPLQLNEFWKLAASKYLKVMKERQACLGTQCDKVT